MRTVAIVCLLLATLTSIAQSGKKTSFKIPKKQSVKLSDFGESEYSPSMQNLEAPYPGGENYWTFIKDQKKKASALVSSNKRSGQQIDFDASLNPVLGENFGMIREVPAPSLDTTFVFNVSGGTPLDNTLALSKNGILLTSVNSFLWGYDLYNDSILFKNTDGSTRLISFANFGDTLIPNPSSSQPFDPKLFYDKRNDRFIFVFLDGRGPSDSQCIIGFSTTSDPRDEWNVYSIPGDPRGQGANWTDYPAISITENELLFTVNMIIPGVSWQAGFDGTVIWQINLDDGYTGATNLRADLWDGITYNNRYVRYLCPVEDHDGPNSYFISNHPWDAQNDTLFLVEVTNTAESGTAELTVTPIKSNEVYGMPPNGRQEDTPAGAQDSLGLQTNDARFLGAVIQNNVIHAVGNTRDFNLNNAGVYHTRISGINSGNLQATANVISVDSLDLGYPKICYPSEGTQFNRYVIGFNHTYTDVYAGISAIVYDDDTDEYSEIMRLKSGENYVLRIATSYERWGDYFGIQASSIPGQVYTAGYYGLQNRSSSTWMNKITIDQSLVSTQDIEPSKLINTTLYPNPVVERYAVQFTTTAKTEVTIHVYDMNGKLVADLGDHMVKVGLNEFSFNASSLASGTYIIKGFNETSDLFNQKLIRE